MSLHTIHKSDFSISKSNEPPTYSDCQLFHHAFVKEQIPSVGLHLLQLVENTNEVYCISYKRLCNDALGLSDVA